MARSSVIEARPRDADRSQKAILDAALAEFAEHGLGGARMDRIAARAGVNKRLIHYYFERISGLHVAANRQVLTRAANMAKGNTFKPTQESRREMRNALKS